jgi:hypothetical protein
MVQSEYIGPMGHGSIFSLDRIKTHAAYHALSCQSGCKRFLDAVRLDIGYMLLFNLIPVSWPLSLPHIEHTFIPVYFYVLLFEHITKEIVGQWATRA